MFKKTLTLSNLAKIAPLVFGVILGIISIVRFPYPTPPNLVYSGLKVIGGSTGYLLAALLVSHINAGSWKRSFFTGALTIIVATIVYYLQLTLSRISGNDLVESYGAMAVDAAKWVVLGVAVGALSATAARFAMYSKRKFLRLGAVIVPYCFFVIVVCINAFRMIDWHSNPGYLTGTWMGYNFYSDVYEAVWSFVLPTILFVGTIIRERKTRDCK
jgi:hypothetical protein